MKSNKPDAKQQKASSLGATAFSLVERFTMRDNEYFGIIRQAIVISVPLLFIAALILLVTLLPIDAYQRFLAETFGAQWRSPLQTIFHSILAIICLAIPLALAANLIHMHNSRYVWAFVPVPFGLLIIFVINLIMMIPRRTGLSFAIETAGLPGLFSALIISVAGSWIFLYLCRIPALRLNTHSDHSEPTIANIFDCFLPGLFTVLFFSVVRLTLSFAGIESLNQLLYAVLQLPFLYINSSLLFGIVYTTISQLCWFFGLHGPEVLAPLTQGFFESSASANLAAITASSTPPHILTKAILDTFVHIGGSGATLGLILALLISKPEKDMKKLTFASAFFGFFNINEILVFGLPIIFNPVFLLPFLLAPLVLMGSTVLFLFLGLVPQPFLFVEWTTPPFFNAYLSTGSWAAVFLQVFHIILACFIYLPFVRLSQKQKLVRKANNLKELLNIASSQTYHSKLKPCFNSATKTSTLARFLASQLEQDIYNKSKNISLLFQPRVDIKNQTVPCVEALLRWKSQSYGDISPVLAMALALEGNYSRKLDTYVLELILQQQYRWRNEGINTTVAMNLSHNQLEDYTFVEHLHAQLNNYQLSGDAIALEIKERTALGSENTQRSNLEAVKFTGINITIDDFGKGYQPIIYLHTLPISEVQISRDLITGIGRSPSKQELVSSINEICNELGIKISVEFVESEEQFDVLKELDLNVFQGYYFAKPMQAEECAKFIKDIKNYALNW